MKICSSCHVNKALSAFNKKSVAPDGLSYNCKECNKLTSKEWKQDNKDRVLSWKQRNPERVKESSVRGQLKHKFGISLEQYNDLLASQDYKCWICGKHQDDEKKRLAVDHRHGGPNKGEITGIICHFCNYYLIGRHTNPELFERAAAYLRQGTGLFVPVRRKKKK